MLATGYSTATQIQVQLYLGCFKIPGHLLSFFKDTPDVSGED